jgi:hypothetical protein
VVEIRIDHSYVVINTVSWKQNKARKLEVKTSIALYALFTSNYDSCIGEPGWNKDGPAQSPALF